LPSAASAIGLRRHARDVDLPLDTRLKGRLGRAITNALVNPGRCGPTLRRTIRIVSSALRAQGFTEEGITARLCLLVHVVALNDGIDATSVVTGKPRWQELAERVSEWVTLDVHVT
jgi:hypothetical protein